MQTTVIPYLKTVDASQANIRLFQNVKRKLYNCNSNMCCVLDCLEFLATDTEVLGSIPGPTRFSEYYWVWNGVHSAS
jgi:hypothetical protein